MLKLTRVHPRQATSAFPANGAYRGTARPTTGFGVEHPLDTIDDEISDLVDTETGDRTGSTWILRPTSRSRSMSATRSNAHPDRSMRPSPSPRRLWPAPIRWDLRRSVRFAPPGSRHRRYLRRSWRLSCWLRAGSPSRVPGSTAALDN